jgi:predicted ribosome quality control (RQC) complex YloA/Tae2 family protein
MKEVLNQDTNYWVGRNAQDNWDIIKNAQEKWIWIHLDKFPSGHVIICKDSDTITDDEIIYGSRLCIEHSKYRNVSKISVVYCEINNLKLGTEIGSVYFKSNHKTKKITF